MKYMLLLYDNPSTRGSLTPEAIEEMQTLLRELTEAGELVGTEGLEPPARAKTVRRTGGRARVTDGPFAEAKEFMGGYLLLDCESEERAVDIASRWPVGEVIEVRPVLGGGGR